MENSRNGKKQKLIWYYEDNKKYIYIDLKIWNQQKS